MAFSLTECHWEMTYFWACPANVWNCHFQHFLGLVGLYWLQKKGILVLTGNRNFQSSQGKLFVFKNFILMEGMPISCTDRVVLRALLNALGTTCKKTLSGRAAPLLFWIKLELLGQQVRRSDSLNPAVPEEHGGTFNYFSGRKTIGTTATSFSFWRKTGVLLQFLLSNHE